MSVTSYAAAYVRGLAADRRLKAQVSACLAKGKAWEQEERLVVCMIDISGYSKLSAGLTFLGKMASEVITKTVGGYLNKIIDVIALYKGDIVRFLGDAVLVSFTPTADESISEAVLRSLVCCLHVATCCKSVDVDMSLASTTPNQIDRTNMYNSLKAGSASLYLHFAITAGNMSRVIIGDPSWRLDYCIQGSGLRSLGIILDNTGKGELGIATDAIEELSDEWRATVESLRSSSAGGHLLLSTDAVAILAGKCCKMNAAAIGSLPVDEITMRFMSVLHSGHARQMSESVADGPRFSSPGENDVDFVRLFVNHSSLRKFDGHKGGSVVGGKSSLGDPPPRDGFQSIERNGGLRKESVALGAADGDDPAAVAEFRNVAAVFVSLIFPFDVELVQAIMSSFLKALKEHKGVFLQYSADDKGQSMLAIFGLPSFSHVNNSDQSVKCVKYFVEDMKRTLGDSLFTKHLAIAIASGEILLTKLGTDYRSEIGLLGDVIVAAARLMGVAQTKKLVVMDHETNERIKLTHVTTDLGLVRLKGYQNDSQIYGLVFDTLGTRGPESGAGQFGYCSERELLKRRFGLWLTEKRKALVIIEAPSGLGKSTLANFLIALAKDHGVPVCLTQGSEMEQWRPFRGLQPILLFILNVVNSIPSHPLSVGIHGHTATSSSFSSLGRHPSNVSKRRRSHVPAGGDLAVNLLGGAAQAFLVKAGVDLNLTPLFAMITPSLAVNETAMTEAMDAEAKINHVKAMVAKIVTAFVQDYNAIFVFDDAQWFDSQTLEVLLTLSRYCPKMAKLSKLTIRVTGIHPPITTAIFAKTAGSPLFLQIIIDVIFAKVGTDLIVDVGGVLKLRDESVHIEAILTDLSAAVLFQFDRLDENFKRLLRTASVFGQYFNLRNVLALGFDMTEKECLEMIEDNDLYNFLIVDPASRTTEAATSAEGEASLDGIECSFRHISILNAIYESLAFRERLTANRSVGLMIESILNEGNREDLLPSLDYHFSRTAEIEKLVKYKEELGFMLVRKLQCVEGIRILESLVRYVSEADPEDLARLEDPITSLRKAWWLARLCICYFATKKFPKDKESGIAALGYLPVEPWPVGEVAVKRAVAVMKRRAHVNWFLTFGGRRKPRRSFRKVLPENREDSIKCEKLILWNMGESLAISKAYTQGEVRYLLLRHLNLLIKWNDDDSEWCRLLFKMAYYSMYTDPGYHTFFLRRAELIDQNYLNCQFLKAVNKVFHPTFRECIPLLHQQYELAVLRSDISGQHFTKSCLTSTAFVFGDFDYVSKTQQFYRTSPTMKDDPVFSFTMTNTIYRVAIARGNLEEMAEWKKEFEPREAIARMFKFGPGMKECLDAWVAALKGDFSGALSFLEECAEMLRIDDMIGNVIDCVVTLPFVFVLLADPRRSGVPIAEFVSEGAEEPRPWKGEELRRLQAIAARLRAITEVFGTGRHNIFSYWCAGILRCVEELMRGSEQRAVKIARRETRCKRHSELDAQLGYKAMFYGVIAKYTRAEPEGKTCRQVSADLFKQLQSPLYLKWLDS